jgi:adenylate cyclase
VLYVLEGSVRKAGNRIRVTAQLIDGITGDHVWAEKYDGELEDIFDLQDRMTQEVVASTQTSIHLDLGTKIRDIDRPDVKIWDLLAKAGGSCTN